MADKKLAVMLFSAFTAVAAFAGVIFAAAYKTKKEAAWMQLQDDVMDDAWERHQTEKN